VRVLVTGATGLIGSRLVRTLAGQGVEVVALARAPDRLPAHPLVKVLEHDLERPLDAPLPSVDAVVHLAHHARVEVPEHARLLYRLNAMSTQELLEGARRVGVARFVYASTGGVYGFGDRPFDEDDAPRGRGLYTLSKRHAEELVAAYGDYLEGVVVRPFFPFGPGQQGRLVARIADRVSAGEPVPLHVDARPRINPVYVDDAVRAFAAVVGVASPPPVLNVAGDDVVDIRQLSEQIGRALGREPAFEWSDEEADGDLVARNERLRMLLDSPLVSLETGLERTFSGDGR
jgi:UDP-glucose 4-epimerase